MLILFAVASLLIFNQLAIGQEKTAPKTVLFANVNIFNGTTNKLITGKDVLVEKNLISKISSNLKIPEGAKVIDGGGRTLMLGLIDSHVQLLYSGTPDTIPAREAMRWDQLAVIDVVNTRDFLMN
jgi:imidazolonepropionase-like amidohydrolase